MKIKKNVKAPELHAYKGKYKELHKALEKMSVGSWIEVHFDEPITSRQRSAVHNSRAKTFDIRFRTHAVDEYTMKVGKLSAKE